MGNTPHIALPLKYRPMTFDDVVGQEHVVKTLRHAIEAGRIANAYLFIGPRGIGKTTMSRIFAKALNCTNPDGVEPCGKCVNCQLNCKINRNKRRNLHKRQTEFRPELQK